MTLGTGSMFPNVSKIFLKGASDNARLNYWDDVHSLNMAPMTDRFVSKLTHKACVEVVEDKNIVTNRAKVIEHDLNTCQDGELDFEAPFELCLRDNVPSSASSADDVIKVHQLVVSFDMNFAVPGS